MYLGIGSPIPEICNLPGQTGEGISAAFSYSKSSFRQDESDPTPTITGTQGGTFESTPSGLSINSSTGTIDLSVSAIRSYTITYTVQGVSAQQSLSVISPITIDNNFSMEFDGASATKLTFETPTPNLQRGVNSPVSISCWVKPDSQSYSNPNYWHSFVCNITGSTGHPGWGLSKGYDGLGTSKIAVRLNQQSDANSSGGGYGNTNLMDGNWHHVLFTMEDAGSPSSGVFLNKCKIYVDGQRENYNNTTTPMEMIIVNNTANNYYLGPVLTIGNITNFQGASDSNYYDGLADEVAIWNQTLSETTAQDIYNATANNSGKVYDLNQVTEGAPAAWYRMGD